MFPSILSSWQVADLTIRYLINRSTGVVGLLIVPTDLVDQIAERRADLRGLPYIDSGPEPVPPAAWEIDPLIHAKRIGDWYPAAFAQGHTLRNSPAVKTYAFQTQEHIVEGDKTTVVTTLVSPGKHRLVHRLSWHEGDSALTIQSEFHNDSDQPVKLEMLTSFSLGGLTPFAVDDAPGRMKIHRYRSCWSAEGRLETRSLEELHLERSWSGAGAFNERFGQVGSMPVRKWFPFVALEDIESKVVWAAQLGWAGSWQMEVFRQNDDVCLSGGLADREFGHWMKTLLPGESLEAPPAYLTCARGSLDDACDRLTALQHRAADTHPKVEADLPIIFNEWCTTWGDPSHTNLLGIADRLQGSPVRYLVIDAGWYKTESSDWGNGHGDWVPSTKLFPEGLAATAQAIRDRGIIPGLWFEMETVGDASTSFSLLDHLLHRDNIPVTVRNRRFWDLTKPATVNLLAGRVIDLLEQGGFGYLKVDYNETIGLGCEHPDSVGEGLRQQILGIYRFFELIRQRMPDLVIENCSSGGHRLEPSMMGRTAMSSFSDAHELVEIPIIAARIHNLLLPRQSQIWAVLKAADSERRLIYSLAATFLGRMCLSGEISSLSRTQMTWVERAERLYLQAAPTIKYGFTRLQGQLGASWRHPHGWQAAVRISADGQSLLIVVHTFGQAPDQLTLTLPSDGSWKLTAALQEPGVSTDLSGQTLTLANTTDFQGFVFLLNR